MPLKSNQGNRRYGTAGFIAVGKVDWPEPAAAPDREVLELLPDRLMLLALAVDAG